MVILPYSYSTIKQLLLFQLINIVTQNKHHGMFRKLSLLTIIPLSFITVLHAQSLREKVQQIAAEAKGKVGVAYVDLETGDTLTLNGTAHLPMQSTFKFPIAMAVLHDVDGGKLSLDQKIRLRKKDMPLKTWSPMRDKYPDGGEVTLQEALGYMVSQSDNVACDVLIKLTGGTDKIESYIHSLGVTDIAIKATEAEMAKEWNVQYTNWSEPIAYTKLLSILYKGTALSLKSNDILWKMMVNTTTGPKRLKGLLPSGTIVAHKTGTSGTNDKGITAATNDVGVIQLFNKKHIALAVMVSDSPADEVTREAVIAKIAKAFADNLSVQ